MRSIIISALLVSSVTLLSFTQYSDFFFPPYLQKKIKKQISKTFDTDEFEMTMLVADSNSYAHDFFEIKNPQSEMIGYGIVTLTNGCKIGGCDAIQHADNAEYEQFYFSTLYNPDGEIANVKVVEYTSERGYEITAKSWLKQFKGKRGGELRVDKEIDGISGATVSVNSIVNEINTQQDYVSRVADTMTAVRWFCTSFLNSKIILSVFFC